MRSWFAKAMGFGVSILLMAAIIGGCTQKSGDWTLQQTQRSAEPRPATQEDVATYDAAVDEIMNLQYAQAEKTLNELLPRFEKASMDTYTAYSMFWLGYCHEKQGRAGSAREFYLRVRDRFPTSRAAQKATEQLEALDMPTPATPKTP